MDFLPVNKKDLKKRNWEQLDFILVTGDAYVDHPSFGMAIISRLLERYGYKVGVISQPDWKELESFKVLGAPKYAFLVSSGNIDSMVNHYTSLKKKRSIDVYSPGGEINKRPDRAVIVYGNKLKEAYKNIPVIIGGIEASLRRFGHYDYWDNKVRRSILIDSAADILVYGMAERQIIEIAEALSHGIKIEELTYIKGTVYKTKDETIAYEPFYLPEYKEIVSDKKKYAESFMCQYKNTDSISGKTLVEKYESFFVVQNPPPMPLTDLEMDDVYDMDFMRDFHPSYKKAGGIPALKEIKFSILSSRGCFGGCSFCAITFHQGRVIQKRSHQSVLKEAEKFMEDTDFNGYIHDLGGPTANFRIKSCKKQEETGVCSEKQCLFPQPCENLIVSHKDYFQLLDKLKKIQGVKRVFIRSGIRYDYLLLEKDKTYLEKLCKDHISGQLKLAPEHVSSKVLDYMGKPDIEIYKRFVLEYEKTNKKLGMKQYVVPYFISSHPGSSLNDAVKLAEYINTLDYMPQQVQDFYPTPGTLSTCMYYTGYDPRTMMKMYIPNSFKEKMMQKALMQFRKKENYKLVYEAIRITKRQDLIGYSEKALIKPMKTHNI